VTRRFHHFTKRLLAVPKKEIDGQEKKEKGKRRRED
jgi:hypothetical protein